MPRYYKCYTRWKEADLVCICKVGNPACDRYKTCCKAKVNINKYDGIIECFKNSEKRK